MTLKEEFEKLVEQSKLELKKHQTEIIGHFKEIEKISEKYGVPVRIRAANWGLNYIPKNMDVKFTDLDQEVMTDCTDVYIEGSLFDYGGYWTNSGC